MQIAMSVRATDTAGNGARAKMPFAESVPQWGMTAPIA